MLRARVASKLMNMHAPMKIHVTAIKIIVRFIKIIVHLSGTYERMSRCS